MGSRLDLLQAVRAIHAVAEAGYSIFVNDQTKICFDKLVDYFHIQITDEDGIAVEFKIDHETPKTEIIDIQRPLIFPHSVVERCRSYWGEREITFSFRGLMTQHRQGYFARFHNKLNENSTWLPSLSPAQRKSISIESTVNGRIYPGKSWDDEFYRELGRSQFVLCPRGDHVWSYRFFEAILCGAIPVVEEASDAYDGFRFYNLGQTNTDKELSFADVEYNFNLCRERIAVPVEEIQAAVESLSQEK